MTAISSMSCNRHSVFFGNPEAAHLCGEDVAQRFLAKVQRSDGCWLWTGAALGTDGYGGFPLNGKPNYAHRVAWVLYHGPIPAGKSVLHHCDTPRCVNPAHLFLGTHLDNMRDAASKGRLHVTRPKRQTVTDEQVAEMKALVRGGMLQHRVAERFGVSKTFVNLLMKGKRRQHPRSLSPWKAA